MGQDIGFVFTREQVRAVDREAVETYRMPSIVLMENASRALAAAAQDLLRQVMIYHDRMRRIDEKKYARPWGPPRMLIVCGGGNNGGDGFAAARHLHNAGVDVTVAHARAADEYDGDAGANLAVIQAMGLKIIDASNDPVAVLDDVGPVDAIMDALLGTGIDSDVREPMDKVIEWIKAQPARVLAVDIPSGLDCDEGAPLGVAVEAEVTVTFVGAKAGFVKEGADRYTGEVRVGDIGVPRELIEKLGTRHAAGKQQV